MLAALERIGWEPVPICVQAAPLHRCRLGKADWQTLLQHSQPLISCARSCPAPPCPRPTTCSLQPAPLWRCPRLSPLWWPQVQGRGLWQVQAPQVRWKVWKVWQVEVRTGAALGSHPPRPAPFAGHGRLYWLLTSCINELFLHSVFYLFPACVLISDPGTAYCNACVWFATAGS